MAAWQKRVHQAVQHLNEGDMVVVYDDADGASFVVCDALTVTAERVNFLARHARGVVSVAIPASRAAELRLQRIASSGDARFAFTVSVEAREGVSTGISAPDRARTISLLATPGTSADDLLRPGHVFPAIGADGGVLARPGIAEAALDLLTCAWGDAGRLAVFCAVLDSNGLVPTKPQASRFARRHGLAMISVRDLVRIRLRASVPPFQEVTRRATLFDGLPIRVLTFAQLPGTDEFILHVADRRHGRQRPVVVFNRRCRLLEMGRGGECSCDERRQHALRLFAERGGAIVFAPGRGREHDRLAHETRPGERDYAVGIHLARQIGLTDAVFYAHDAAESAALEGYGAPRTHIRQLGVMGDSSPRRAPHRPAPVGSR